MANSNIDNLIAFPWSNTRLLAESLHNGELGLSTAISQVSAVLRDSLKIIEDFSSDQIKSNLDRKLKVERMEKLIAELTEKCQGMQQALLYKEEKYDEKCREVERYKIICELSANRAQDDIYFPNDNSVNLDTNNNIQHHDVLEDVDINLSQDEQDLDLARYYAGGPSKRKRAHDTEPSTTNPKPPVQGSNKVELKIRDQMSIIGGVNIRGPRSKLGPVPVNKLIQGRVTGSLAQDNDDYVKRPKVSMIGQRNNVMSSSRNAMVQLKHEKFTQSDLHRQVAGGCWNRFTGRRKKEWPF